MYHPSFEEFRRKAEEGNLIPVYKEMAADLETPVSAFYKIGEDEYSFLLESVEGGEKIARYSFLGNSPSLIFKSKGKETKVIKNGVEIEKRSAGDLLKVLKELMVKYRPVKVRGLPRFCGGAVGFLGYDMIRFFERLPDRTFDDLYLPDSIYLLTESLLAFDHVTRRVKVISNAHIKKDIKEAYQEAVERIERILERLKKPLVLKKGSRESKERVEVTSNFTPENFQKQVLAAKRYIESGDIIQVVLSQRLSTRISAAPFDIYRALRMVNPSPYMFYLKFGDFQMVGSSPELLVRVEDGIAEVRPIAGTRPRGKCEEEDERLIRELLADPKERAEHIMLVDLARNDLGRVCEYGSIQVTELMGIEKYSHVMHIVSNVKGRLRKDRDQFDLLRACFPAGTVSGAPKIRAMEIIEELESTKRGPYAGAVGYFGFSGNLDTCITIRTIVIKRDSAFVQAGAGIVADSEPEKEYQETMNKAKALLKAVEMAEEGL